MNFSTRPLILVDVETTGLDPQVHDVLEIGAIKLNQQTLDEESRFSCKVHPWFIQPASTEALLVNGYKAENWMDALSLHQAMREFSSFAQAGVLTSWNITFEYGFLQEAFRRTGISNPLDYHRIDIPSIVWFTLPSINKFSLNDVAESLGLKREPEPHRAITGAEYEAAVLRILTDRRKNECQV